MDLNHATALHAIPQRTPLADDELGTRTGKLSQRHRTALLLIDGRRTVAQVLSLCELAGATRTHLEQLVSEGFVQLQERRA